MDKIIYAFQEFITYWGNGLNLILFLAALFYLVFQGKEMWKNHFFGKLVLIIMICTMNPLGAFVIQKCIGEDVFWRVFWTIPSGCIISYALVQVIYENFPDPENESPVRCSKSRVCIFLFAMFAIILSGEFMYKPANFIKVDNVWQIPEEAIEVCDIVNADAKLEGETVKMLAPAEISNYARQYDASILLLAGRNTRTTPAKKARKIYGGAISESSAKRLLRVAKNNDCNYLVFYRDPLIEQLMEGRKYSIMKMTDKYIICKRN